MENYHYYYKEVHEKPYRDLHDRVFKRELNQGADMFKNVAFRESECGLVCGRNT